MAFLTVERGSEKGRRIDLGPGRTVVFGRDPACDVVITDHLCAPRHFEVFEKDGAFFVRDLGSEAGTLVNEERMAAKCKLRPGDTIHVGETQFSFSAEEGAASKAARMVGGYRIVQRIGRGGMGAVYKAIQVSLNRTVALKILSHRISADPAFVKRFQAEAQAAGRLNHPNIVQVYDVGFDQGVHFFSMEFIENGSVQDLATRVGRLDVDLALAIATDAARGLVYAEKHGLVHRDIKPDNLMINSEGVVKIADLGLALDAGERARHAGEGSQDEEDIFGTPQFISPEQAQGKPVDTRSDIYSLGASLYRLVTGQPPFSGENIPEIVRKQIEETPEPVRNLRPDCPPAVAAIIERAMQKDPAARFQTAAELLAALEAADSSAKGRAGRAGLIAAAVAVLALVGGAAWFFTRPKPEPAPIPVIDAGGRGAESRGDSRHAGDSAAIVSIQRERDAARAARQASEFEKQAIATGAPDLAAIRQRYQRVAEGYPETPDGRQAADRVRAIDRELAEAAAREAAARTAAESRDAAAAEAAATAASQAAGFEASDQYSSALGALKGARAKVAKTGHQVAVETAIAQTSQRAESRASRLVADAGAAEAEGRTADADKILADALSAFGSGPSGPDPSVDAAIGRIRTASEDIRAARERKRTTDAAHDAVVIDRTRRDVHKGMLASFDPGTALGILDAARARARSPEGVAAVDAERAAIEAAARLRDRFVSSLTPEDPKGLKVKLPAPDRKRLVDHTVVRADAKGLTVRRGTVESHVPFTSLSALETYDQLLDDVVARDASLRPDAFELLLFLGAADRALAIAQELPEGEARQRAIARASREQQAWAMLAEVRDLGQRAAADDTALARLHRVVRSLIEEYRDTRAYLLNRRPPPRDAADSQPAPR